LIILAPILTERIRAIFEELAQAPTPSPYRHQSPCSTSFPSKRCPLSPSSITEPSSPPAKLSSLKLTAPLSLKPTSTDFRLLKKEKEDALEEILRLQERLDSMSEEQEITSKRLADVQVQLHLALKEADRLRAVLKEEGERLLRAC
jgi:hypothetical protein